MPQFAVYYSFTCSKPVCGHKNAQRERIVTASDKDAAAKMVHAEAKCLKCGEALPTDKPMTVKVVAL